MEFADVGGYEIGFPFTFYRWEFGYTSGSHFVWFGLITDILVAIAFVYIVGLIFRFIWSSISSRRLSLK